MENLIPPLLESFKVDNPLDLLVEYATSQKTEKSLRELIESNAKHISDILSENYTHDMLLDDKSMGFLKECSLPANVGKFYITISGLAKYLSRNEIDWQEKLITAIEGKRLPDLEIRLKKEERLFVFTLLILGATSEDKALVIGSDEVKQIMYRFVQKIDNQEVIRSTYGDAVITWGKGKKISWTKFLTEWVDLPKTGLYFKISRDGKDYFYLDLTSNGKINALKDYLLNSYNIAVADKLVLYDYVRGLSNKLILELNIGYIIPPVSDSILKKLFH